MIKTISDQELQKGADILRLLVLSTEGMVEALEACSNEQEFTDVIMMYMKHKLPDAETYRPQVLQVVNYIYRSYLLEKHD